MALRYTDLNKTTSIYSDFISRRRFSTLLELFVICVGIIIFGVGVSPSVRDTIALCSILFACVGAMTCYTITQLNRSRDLLQATECENALFASAMDLHHAFSGGYTVSTVLFKRGPQAAAFAMNAIAFSIVREIRVENFNHIEQNAT